MQLDQYRSKGTEIRDFGDECQRLWTEHIRTDLIYSKKLLLCKACLGFFYQRPDADHPKAHVVMAQQYLIENDITSLERFADFFKPSSTRSSGEMPAKTSDQPPSLDPQALIPTFTFKHRANGASGHLEAKEVQRFGSKDSQRYLVEHVEHMKKQLCDQKCEIEALRAENEDLLLQMVRLRAKVSSEKRAVARLANHVLLYTEEDWCCGDTGQPGQDKPHLK